MAMTMTMSIRLMALKVRDGPPVSRGEPQARRNPDNWPVTYLIGEWIPAWGWMSIAFLVAFLGVLGLGVWVLRGDYLNRRFDDGSPEEPVSPS